MEDSEYGDFSKETPRERRKRVRAVYGRTLAKTHDRYRVIIANLLKLPDKILSTLAIYGWGPERIEQLRKLLQRYLDLCSDREREKRNFHQAAADVQKLRRSLVKTYRLRRNTMITWGSNQAMHEKLLKLVK